MAPASAAIANRSGTVSMAMIRSGAPDSKLRHRATAKDSDGFTAFDVAELCSHVSGRKDVGEEEYLLVAQSLGHFDGADISKWDTQILRLATGESSQQM
jgi:hypothetical protein